MSIATFTWHANCVAQISGLLPVARHGNTNDTKNTNKTKDKTPRSYYTPQINGQIQPKGKKKIKTNVNDTLFIKKMLFI